MLVVPGQRVMQLVPVAPLARAFPAVRGTPAVQAPSREPLALAQATSPEQLVQLAQLAAAQLVQLVQAVLPLAQLLQPGMVPRVRLPLRVVQAH